MTVNLLGIEEASQRIHQLRLPHPLRVAVDGRIGCGKTTFANALAATMKYGGRPVIRASIDGFHQPRINRYRQGRLSSDGYYEDAHDLKAMRQLLLDPLGPGGDRICVTASFDLDRDQPLKRAPKRVGESGVLIVDGEFLQRPELQSAWDLVIFLNVSAQEARRRGVERDALLLRGTPTAAELHDQRYGPAFSRYEREWRPAAQADVVIDNEA